MLSNTIITTIKMRTQSSTRVPVISCKQILKDNDITQLVARCVTQQECWRCRVQNAVIVLHKDESRSFLKHSKRALLFDTKSKRKRPICHRIYQLGARDATDGFHRRGIEWFGG